MRAMTTVPSDAIWTVPNALSFLRLALLPLFLWLALGVEELGWAYAVGFLGFITDVIDGPIARRSGTVTKLGTLLDPLADRLSLAAGVVVIIVHDLAWAPLVWIVVVRDATLVVFGAVFIKATHREIPPVTWLGKRASFLVSLGLGTFILAGAVGHIDAPNELLQRIAYGISWVGVATYLVTFAGYVSAGLRAPRKP